MREISRIDPTGISHEYPTERTKASVELLLLLLKLGCEVG
jgi:hypothetical protein